MNNLTNRLFVVTFILFLCTSIIGCRQFDNTTSLHNTRKLHITVKEDDSAGFTTITADQLGDHFQNDIVYLNLSEVEIEVNHICYPLEVALRNELISVEEIFAYARIDARNRICSEKYRCDNSLTYFTYSYPEFDIELVYDIYRAPDGSTHLINDLGVYKTGSSVNHFLMDDKTGQYLNREDWGINFNVVTATPSSIKLSYTQSGGQQFGDLYIHVWSIYDATSQKGIFSKSYDTRSEITEYPECGIQENGSNFILLDWSEEITELPPGEYKLTLHLIDIYDSEYLHPFMYDYCNVQDYSINFAIS